MKKQVILLLLMAFAFVSAGFARDMSVGGGIGFEGYSSSYSYEYSGYSGESKATMGRFGAEAFLDAAYIQAGIGFSSFLLGQLADSGGTFSYFAINVYGKYPIEMGGFTFFPMVGFEYISNFAYTDEDGNDLKSNLTQEQKDHLNEFWLKLGAGADFDINENTYFRVTGLFGYKFQSEYEKDNIKAAEDSGAEVSLSTMNTEIGLGVGFRL